MMQTRRLGRTGADVTILGYGAMELRGQPHGPAISDDDAGRLLNEVLDAGINLIDTSIDYGRSEELIGRYLGHRRGEFFLASKCGCLLGPPPAGASPPFPHDYSAGKRRAPARQPGRRRERAAADRPLRRGQEAAGITSGLRCGREVRDSDTAVLRGR
jgi:aryl-alcohol dehydrogenase-like predicted oxidoreductase